MAKKKTIEELEQELLEKDALIETLSDEVVKLEKKPNIASEKPTLTVGEQHYSIVLPKFTVLGKTITAEEMAGNPEEYAKEIAYLLENQSEILKPL